MWGPHLIVVPTSVMLNWEVECKKWCPAFKLLTYYGSAKERKAKRHGWSKPNAFHICITSYTLVLQASPVCDPFRSVKVFALQGAASMLSYLIHIVSLLRSDHLSSCLPCDATQLQPAGYS